jgi:hypothetical protein
MGVVSIIPEDFSYEVYARQDDPCGRYKKGAKGFVNFIPGNDTVYLIGEHSFLAEKLVLEVERWTDWVAEGVEVGE